MGGVPATVNYSGRTPCCSGVDQIAFVVPANAPQGCWVPVYVRTGSTTVSNFVSMAIAADGSSCLNSGSVPPFFGAGKVRQLLFAAGRDARRRRSTVNRGCGWRLHRGGCLPGPRLAVPVQPSALSSPRGYLHHLRGKRRPAARRHTAGRRPAGCKDAGFRRGFHDLGQAGRRSSRIFLAEEPLRWLGSSISSNLFSNSRYLNPGTFHIAGTGGSDVGPFSVSSILQPLAWTNRDQLTLVDRSTPLTVSWSGGSGGQVAIIGFGVDLPTDSTTIFGCLAPQGATSFSVPPIVLSNVPATRANPLQSKSVVFL